jgi:two-component system, OmpR family, catabolic regulation response regulator CreB
MTALLLVEDDPAIAQPLAFTLEREGFSVIHVTLGRAALDAIRTTPPAAVILDVGLPDITGFEVCRQLRGFSTVPVLFLTAQADEIDRVMGLEIGADDYVTKPFSPREVVARIRSLLRRAAITAEQAATPAVSTPPATVGAFAVDDARAQIRFHGQVLTLTVTEYRLLLTLLAQPGRVFAREQLIDAARGLNVGSGERAIDTHVKGLRAKLATVHPASDPIRTHRGLGYSVEP